MHTITIGGYNTKRPEEERTFTFPASWKECTPAQLGSVVALTNVPLPDTEDEELLEDLRAMRRVQLLLDLCALPKSLAKNITDARAFVFDGTDDKGDPCGVVLPQLDWAFAPTEWVGSLLKEVTHGGNTWHGPDDGLVNFTVKRWGYTDACLGKMSTGEPKALQNLLGALYVPAGDPWTNEGIEARGERLASLPEPVKLAAWANYKAIRSWLPKKYPNAFQGGAEDPNGVHGLIVDLAGPKFGKTTEAEAAPLHDVLIYVNKCKIEAIERDNKIIVPEDYVQT